MMRSVVGTNFDRLDRFGRVIDQRWTNAAGTATLDRYAYGHDRAGNRTFKENVLGSNLDELYAYDPLHRLAGLDRGALSGTKDSIATLAFAQQWQLEMLGNWRGFKQDDNGTLNERLYVLQDVNFNVTAIVDDEGDVVERYTYDPYGRRTVRNPNWSVHTDPESGDLATH